MKKIAATLNLFILAALLCIGASAVAQTTYWWAGYDWVSGGTTAGAYWSYNNSWATTEQGTSYNANVGSVQGYANFGKWGTGAPPSGLYNTTNDLANNAMFQLYFKSDAPAAYGLYGTSGKGLLFYNYGSADPNIQNEGTTYTPTINMPITNANGNGAYHILNINLNASPAQGPITFNGRITCDNGQPLHVINIYQSAVNITNTFNGVISDYDSTHLLAISQLGSGVTLLTATNTYSGDTTVNAGTLVLATNDATMPQSTNFIRLGDITGSTGANLNLNGGNSIRTSINVRNGSSGGKIIANTAGTVGAATFGGPLYMDDSLTLYANSGGGVVLTNSTLDLKAQTLTVDGPGTNLISGILTNSTGSGSLVKNGTGILTLANTNTYTGLTTVSGGTLQIGNVGTAGAVSGSISLTGGSLSFKRTDAYTQAGTIAGSSYGSTINNVNTLNGNTNTLTFANGINNFGMVQNTSAGALLLVGSANSTNNTALNNSSSATATLQLNGGYWLVTNSFAPGGSNLVVNGATVVVTNSAQSYTTTNLIINSGSLVVAGGGRFGNGFNNQTITIAGGNLTVTNTSFGLRLGNSSQNNYIQSGYLGLTVNQTGGTFYSAANSSANDLSMGGTSGAPGANITYTMTGGQLILPSGAISLGSDSTSNSTTAFTLMGTGKIFVSTIQGGQSTALQVFNFSGGTNVAGTITMSKLLSTNAAGQYGPYGTLFNNGGTLAPGDLGTPGKTTITGNYTNAATAVLDIDINGTSQANAFTNGAGYYDYVSVSTNALLNGTLVVRTNASLTGVTSTTAFTILTTAANGRSGTFNNIHNNRVAVLGGNGASMGVIYTTTSVILTNYAGLSAAFTAGNGTTTAALTGLTDASVGAIASWDLNWGDGTTHYTSSTGLSGANGTHTYAAAGTYTLTLTVTASDGTTANTTQTINIGGPVTWVGDSSVNAWDFATANWTNNVSGPLEKYLDGDLVTFDDTGSATPAVALNTTVTPTSAIFNNSTKNYTVSGSGAIAGTGGLTKSNSGTVTLLTTNAYTGVTAITGGTLVVTNDGATGGALAGLGKVPASATAGNVVLNGGTLSATNSYTLHANRGIAVGPASGSGSGTLDVASGQTLTVGGIIANNSSGTGGLTKTSSGTLTLSGASTFSGGVTLNSGTLNLNNAGSGGTSSAIGTGTLTIAGGTTIDNSSTTVALSTANPMIWNGDFTFTGSHSLTFGSGAVTLGNATRQVTVSANTLTIGGGIGDGNSGYGLTKAGAGTLQVNGVNSFSGPTTVNAGGLIVGGTLAAGSAVTVNTGAGMIISSGGTVNGRVEVVTNLPGATTVSFTNSATVAGNLAIDGTGQTNWLQANIAPGNNTKTNTAWVTLLGGSSTSVGGYITNNGGINLYGSTPLSLGTIVAPNGVSAIDDYNTGGKTVTFASGSVVNFYKDEANAVSTLQVAGIGSVFINYFGYNDNGSGVSPTTSTYTNYFNGGTWSLGYVGQNNSGNHFVGIAWITNNASVTVLNNSGYVHGTYLISGGSMTFNGSLSEGHPANGFGLNLAVTNGSLNVAGSTTIGMGSGPYSAANNLTIGSGGTAKMSSLQIGTGTAQTAETDTTTLAAGKLYVTNQIQGVSAPGAGQTSSFIWSGGQLTAQQIYTYGFNGGSSSINSSTCTLTNSAGTLAPGDLLIPGKTTIYGTNVMQSGAALAMDIGGSSAASGFQDLTGNSYDNLQINGTATLGGTLTVNVLNSFDPSVKSFTIITATNGLSGNFTGLPSGSRVAVANRPGSSFRITYNTAAVGATGTVVLDNFEEVVWGGYVDNNWNTPNNWTNPASGFAANYADGKAVTFDDTAVASATNVTLNQTVLPASVTFSNAAYTYSLSGSGNISGSAVLNKLGMGKVVLSTTNDYTGLTTINAGVLTITTSNALGSVSAGTVVASGAELQIAGGITTLAEPLTLSGTGTNADGALRSTAGNNNYAGPISFTSSSASRISADSGSTLTLSSTTPLAGANTLYLSGLGSLIVNSPLQISNGKTLQIDSNSKVTLNASNSIDGGVTLSTGALVNIGNSNALGTNVFLVSGNGSFDNTSGGAMTISNAITMNGGSPTFVGTSDLTINGAVTIQGNNRTITVNAGNLTFAGGIGDSGQIRNLTKAGSGRLILSQPATYGGNTIVSAGTLALNGSASLLSTNIIVAGNATFDVSALSGGLVLTAYQTLTNSSSTAILNGSIDVSLGTNSLTYTAGTPSLVVTNGNLNLATTSVIKIYGTSLLPGSYKIIAKATSGNVGAVVGSVPSSVNVVGGPSAGAPALSIVNGELWLTVGGASTWSYSATGPFTYTGSAQSPIISFSGSTGTKTTNYVGTGSTTYSSANPPTSAGIYYVSNTVAADANYFGTTNSQSFTINQATSGISYGGTTTFIYNGLAQSPTISLSGSTGAKTTNYVGTGSTTYLSVNPPTSAGSYALTNTVLSDANYVGATNGVIFTIAQTNLTITAQPNTKIYDGGTSATNAPTITAGSLQSGDVATLTEAYADATVGTGKTLIPSIAITNAGVNVLANYNVTPVNDTTGVINPAQATTALLLTNSVGVTNYYGQTLVFTAVVQTNSVTAANASSNVVFSLGSTPVWTNAVVGGVAYYTNDDQTVGVTNFTAQYSGDNNYLSSSVTVTQTVLQTTPTLTLTVSAITYGQTLGSSSLSGSVATNGYDVDADVDAAVAGSFAFANSGIAPNAGSTNVWVIFTPTDTTNYITVSNAVSVTVNQASPGLTQTSSSPTNGYRTAVSFTATLPVDATGSVVFSTTNGAFSTNAVSSGSATSLSITNLPRGTNVITVAYLGDGNYVDSTNTLDQIVTNHPPVANVMNVLRTPGQMVLIALSEMATNWSDLDGDTVQLTAFDATTTNGVYLTPLNLTTNSGGYVTSPYAYLGYTNSPNVNDQFNYTISDGYGGAASCTVNIVVSPFVAGTQTITGQQTTNSITGGSFTVTYYGIPGYTYLLERSTNLFTGALWVDIATNTIGGGGVTNIIDTFSDIPGGHPSSAYYRVGWKPAY